MNPDDHWGVGLEYPWEHARSGESNKPSSIHGLQDGQDAQSKAIMRSNVISKLHTPYRTGILPEI